MQDAREMRQYKKFYWRSMAGIDSWVGGVGGGVSAWEVDNVTVL